MAEPAPVIPGAVRWIAQTLEDNGYETWTVGGALRDHLLGTPSGDWDLATRARPEDMQRVFRRTVPIGVEHGTVGVLSRDGVMHEVTTFRRDVETFGRHATVAFADTLDEDLSRRDFTINSLAFHPLRSTWYDPFDGAGDLRRRVLRTVGIPAERFREDYLRILRGLRFAGALRLTIEGETWKALVEGVERTEALSPERLRDELEKILATERPSLSLSLYAAAGVLDRLYPEVGKQAAQSREGRRDRPGRWLSHALLVSDAVPARRANLRWAAVLMGSGEWPGDLGCGEATRPAPERAVLRAAALLERLRSSRARIRDVAGLCRWAAYPPPADATDRGLRRWCARATREAVPDLIRLWIAEARVDGARDGGKWTRATLAPLARRLRAVLSSGAPLSIGEIALSGDDLIRMGYKPGRHFRPALERLLDLCLDDPAQNERGRLEDAVPRIMAEVMS